jgi:hypothetical protein
MIDDYGADDYKRAQATQDACRKQLNFDSSKYTQDCKNASSHSVVLVGYQDAPPPVKGGGWFTLRNSWGPGWGDGGYCRISYETTLANAYSLFTIGNFDGPWSNVVFPLKAPETTPAPIAASPTKLAFTAAGQRQFVQLASEQPGSFTAPDSCKAEDGTEIATITPRSATTPGRAFSISGQFRVTAKAGGSCSVVVTGQAGQTTTFSVSVTTTIFEIR